jgi:ABC-type polysaccharide/polyol phosphate transport system ATPase subunit
VLGYSKKYIDEHFDQIVDFAELRDFLDMPIKNYSSGMVARIAFAIATVSTPDILIVDEILSVGDFLFQEKCEKRIADMMSGGTTVLIVSHAIDQIERLCQRVIWLEKGKVKKIGETKEVCAEYQQR